MVDRSRFDAASRAYAAADWRAAAQGYLSAVVEGDPDNAEAYAKAGNAFMKMRRWADATLVLQRAVTDPAYASTGSVWNNLGIALYENGEYEQAVRAFDVALTDPSFDRRYRAWQCRAGALARMGRDEEAALNYRNAASDPSDPNPAKALNNLGLLYVKLDRPEEAVQAFRAALEVPGYTGRAGALANLGVAYMKLGFTDRAAEVFAQAQALGCELPAPLAAVAKLAQDLPPSGESFSGSARVVEITTEDHGERSTISATGAAMTAGGAAIVDDLQDAQNDTGFFEVDDADMKRIDMERRKQEAKSPSRRRAILSWVAGIVLLLALVAGALAASLLTGFGWPTQSDTAYGLLNAYKAGQAVDSYWVAVPQTSIDKAMSKIPPTFASAKVTRVKNTSPFAARASVTVAIPNGAPLDYVVTLQREGVGWKVLGIENDWTSTTGTP